MSDSVATPTAPPASRRCLVYRVLTADGDVLSQHLFRADAVLALVSCRRLYGAAVTIDVVETELAEVTS